ncbi:MAG: hypothetical protein H0T15_01490 [Thermoleophilaceae bacterium]|nr:hypothetical protein [Thermoleophilaceae bacterium]
MLTVVLAPPPAGLKVTFTVVFSRPLRRSCFLPAPFGFTLRLPPAGPVEVIPVSEPAMGHEPGGEALEGPRRKRNRRVALRPPANQRERWGAPRRTEHRIDQQSLSRGLHQQRGVAQQRDPHPLILTGGEHEASTPR